MDHGSNSETTEVTLLGEPIIGTLDKTLSIQSDSQKVFKFQRDPYTHSSNDGKPLATLSNITITIYRGQSSSGLFIVPDFNYRTYEWNFPHKFFIIKPLTAQGVVLETIRLTHSGDVPACPARVIHFNYTYRAANDYFGVCAAINLAPNPPGTLIPHC